MNNVDSIIEIKKKYTERVIKKQIYYLLIIVIFATGFLIKFTDTNYNIKEKVYWYSIKLVDFNYEATKWGDLKNVFNGYYIAEIAQIIFLFAFLLYLPYVLKELKKKIFNNSNLYLIDNKLKGTYSKFFKMKEFEIDITDIKQCDIKKVRFKYFNGNKKLNIYTKQEKYSLYYIEDLGNVKEMIDKVAAENNVVYEKIEMNNIIKNKFKSFFTSMNQVLDKISDNIASKVPQNKTIEQKIDEINKLQAEGKINNLEYEILIKEILNKYKK